MPHEVADQAAVLVDPLRARAIGDARGLHDRLVRAHVIHDAHQAVVQDADRLAQDLVERRHARALHGSVLLGHLDEI